MILTIKVRIEVPLKLVSNSASLGQKTGSSSGIHNSSGIALTKSVGPTSSVVTSTRSITTPSVSLGGPTKNSVGKLKTTRRMSGNIKLPVFHGNGYEDSEHHLFLCDTV